jgi:hypothetical protein
VLGWVDGGVDGGMVLGRVALECQKVAAVPLSSSPARDVNKKSQTNLRDRSCRLRCSLRLKARLQYWHLYFFSGADAAFRGVVVEDEASVVVAMILQCDSVHTVAVAQSMSEVLLPRASLLLKG